MTRTLAVASAAIMVGALLSLAPTAANAVETDLIQLEDTNIELLENLSAADECLWNKSVFPAGGVGYEDSSLPYDDMDETTAAALTVRAEALRDNMDVVMGVEPVGEDKLQTLQILVSDTGTERTPEELLAGSKAGLESLSALNAQGITVEVRAGSFPSISEVCQIEDRLDEMTSEDGSELSYYAEPNTTTGTVDVIVDAPITQTSARSNNSLFEHVNITVDPQLSSSARHNDTSPFNAGGYIGYTDRSTGEGMRCTSAFRLNGNSMLTAEHCNGDSFRSGSGVAMGNRYLPLDGANMDIQLIADKSYSGRMWTGSATSGTSLPAYGNYPYNQTAFGAQILLSGAKSGQSSLGYTGSWTQLGYAQGCFNLGGEGKRCQAAAANAPAGKCIGGDSGGPLAAYDPANGRVIPFGVQSATSGNRDGDHKCIFTHTVGVAYAYGGATLG
ncbi:hypothetical protein [Pseudoclavibacter helvolus]|uniref:hypothetical protein n=1 Tax=Pseudoclavibacter helvolus TaxID=255205 RepID=UPI00373585B0